MAANARRQRQTYAKCGPRMQQSACDPAPLGSSDFINKWERIGPKQRLNGVCRPCRPRPGTQGQAASATRGDSSHFSERATQRPPSIHPARRNRNRGSLGLPRRGHRRPGGFRPIRPPKDPGDACRLNFVTKPPSSGGGTWPLAVLERARILKTSSQDIRRGYRDDS
jgi:hypothetical protein